MFVSWESMGESEQGSVIMSRSQYSSPEVALFWQSLTGDALLEDFLTDH